VLSRKMNTRRLFLRLDSCFAQGEYRQNVLVRLLIGACGELLALGV